MIKHWLSRSSAIAVAVGLAAITTTSGSAVGAATTGAGTSQSQMSFLNVQLGTAGAILGIRVLPDTFRSTNDPAILAAAEGKGHLAALELSSTVVPLLNQSLPAGGLTTQTPGGQGSVQGAAISLPAALSTLGTGAVLPGLLTSAVDTAGARSTLSSSIADLSVISGTAGVHVLTSALTTAASPLESGTTRALHLDALTAVNLGALLSGLGIPLGSLSLTTVSNLVKQLGVAVPGVTDTVSLDQLVTALQGAIVQVNTAIGTAATTVDSTLSGTLGSVLGGVGLPTPVVGATLATLLTTLTSQLSTALTDGLNGLTNINLVELDGVNVAVSTTAKSTLAETKNAAEASFGALKIAGVEPLPGLTLASTVTAVKTVTDQASAALDQVLGTIAVPGVGSLAGLVRVGLLTKDLPTPTTVNNYNRASAGLSVLTVQITPPAFLAALIAQLGTPVGSLAAGLPALPGLEAIQGPGGLLGGATGISSLAGGARLELINVASVSEFTPEPAKVIPKTSGPPTNLPRTGGSTPFVAGAAVILALGLGTRRALRRSATRRTAA